MRSASVSWVRELGRFSVTSAARLARSADAADPQDGRAHADHRVARDLLRGALPPVLAQGVGDLVAHDRGGLVVGELQLLQDAGVEGDLAARHAPGVDLGRRDHVDFPGPAGGVLPEHRGVRDDPGRDGPDPLDLLRIAVDGPLVVRLAEGLLVGQRGALVHLLRGQQEELPPLDADRAPLGGAWRILPAPGRPATPAASHARMTGAYSLTRKCARRFFAQQGSARSVQAGRCSP